MKIKPEDVMGIKFLTIEECVGLSVAIETNFEIQMHKGKTIRDWQNPWLETWRHISEEVIKKYYDNDRYLYMDLTPRELILKLLKEQIERSKPKKKQRYFIQLFIYSSVSLAGMLVSHFIPGYLFWYWVVLSLYIGHVVNRKNYLR